MTSLRSYEGYMLVDHRESPGVPDAIMVQSGFNVGAGRGLYESATFTCPYCNAVCVLFPDRSRNPAFDRATNHYICPGCEAKKALGVPLKTINQIADELRNQAANVPQTTEMFQSPVIPADTAAVESVPDQPPPAPPEPPAPKLILP